jgi:hypothetical protein
MHINLDADIKQIDLELELSFAISDSAEDLTN